MGKVQEEYKYSTPSCDYKYKLMHREQASPLFLITSTKNVDSRQMTFM
jgi:hypothetical protein